MQESDWSMRVVAVAAPVREQLIQNLRQAIIEMRLRPGQKLVERELIEDTGVSRTSVREALRQLAAEGLVKTIPHKGTFVARPTPEEAQELFDIRVQLESLAARRFAERATEQQIDELKATLAQLAETADVQGRLKVKDNFYRILGSCTPTTYEMLSGLHMRITALRATSLSQTGRPGTSLLELEAIVRAIANRDPDGAATASAYHVQSAASVCFEAMGDGYGPRQEGNAV